jgi:hypothetical protein
MRWYAAHAIMVTKFKDGNQNKFPIWENIILVIADSPDEAREKATMRARDDEGDSLGTYRYEGREAVWVFEGIRKLIECQDAENQPHDGTELTYSVFEVDSEELLRKLVQGKPARILYEE